MSGAGRRHDYLAQTNIRAAEELRHLLAGATLRANRSFLGRVVY